MRHMLITQKTWKSLRGVMGCSLQVQLQLNSCYPTASTHSLLIKEHGNFKCDLLETCIILTLTQELKQAN